MYKLYAKNSKTKNFEVVLETYNINRCHEYIKAFRVLCILEYPNGKREMF